MIGGIFIEIAVKGIGHRDCTFQLGERNEPF